jgi:PDZ domain/Aspartyl protease
MSMHKDRFRNALIVGLFFVTFAHAEDPKPSNDSNVLEKFAVAKDGDALVLPVKLKGKSYLFLLDSGASHNIFDPSLPLGEPLDEIKVEGAAGAKRLKIYTAPEATLGGLILKTDEPVIGYDLSKIREVSGREIYGVLGTPFLRRHVVTVDFHKGELLVLKAVSREAGEKLSVDWQGGTPILDLDILGSKEQTFMIDTGYNGNFSLSRRLFDTSLKNEGLKVVGRSLIETISGTSEVRTGKVRLIEVGKFALRNCVVDDGERNLIGLGLLARFVVTFDFPNDAVYLKKGKRYDEVDTWDHSGLHIIRRDGRTVLHSVDKESAGEAAGLKTDDLILQVDGTKVDSLTLFQLRKLFHKEGKKVTLLIRRGDKEQTVSLTLAG